MVQDLWIMNETVVPLHPTVPNRYVILGEIPPRAKWFTVLDLKDTFFCIPLAKESQYFLPLSGRPQEKNTDRLLGQYYLRSSEIAPTCLDRPLAEIS